MARDDCDWAILPWGTKPQTPRSQQTQGTQGPEDKTGPCAESWRVKTTFVQATEAVAKARLATQVSSTSCQTHEDSVDALHIVAYLLQCKLLKPSLYRLLCAGEQLMFSHIQSFLQQVNRCSIR